MSTLEELVLLAQVKSFFADRHMPETGPNNWIEPLSNVWFPLAQQIIAWRESQADPTLIVGFLGGQGSGKTTLTALLCLLLEHQGYSAMSWSLDDLYLPHADRQLLEKRDPRLSRRGPPGTHDVELGIQVLNQFKAQETTIEVPQFDKSLFQGAGDRINFKTYAPVDFVLFEGWFVGAQPIVLPRDLPDPIITEADRDFARDMNMALEAYLPLWERLDRLVILELSDYHLSKQWRKQAEQLMRSQGKPGMSDQAIDEFVEYFWKALHPELFVTPLTKAPEQTDWVMEIGIDHLPILSHPPASHPPIEAV
jgi:D-glycerate 3-kinase